MVIYRAWTHTDAVSAVHDFLAVRRPRRGTVRKLMEEVCGNEPAIRKRATDLARLVSAREPGILSEWVDVLMDVLAELRAEADSPASEWQSCGYLALAAAHNVQTRGQRTRLAALLRPMIDDTRNAIRATAIEAFTRVAVVDPELRNEALAMLEEARGGGTPAVRSRARAMLTLLSRLATKKQKDRDYSRPYLKS